MKFDECFIRKEPLGVVLIIGAWNYPVQLVLVPLIGAIAAGGVSVARSVMRAASCHLTPVTLELGGKSPALVEGSCDVMATARRLVWARFFNAGQSCVAPDYVLCSEETRRLLLPALRDCITQLYGTQPRESRDFGRIINQRHFKRIRDLLSKSQGRVEIGGETEEGERYIGERGETEEGERYIGERGETEEGERYIGERGETEEGERYIGERGETEEGERYIGERGETEEGERYIGERGETEEGERYIGERGETEEGERYIGERGETEEGERYIGERGETEEGERYIGERGETEEGERYIGERGETEEGERYIGERGETEEGERYIGERGETEEGERYIGERGETEEGERYIGERGETEEGERYIGERGETEEGERYIGERGETEEGERYIGGVSVARSVMRAASCHLTPVTLELGGKSPALVEGSCDVMATARRLVWARFFNAGQSCVAPDYVLCSEETRRLLLPALRDCITQLYGTQPRESRDFGRIINQRHFKRIRDLLSKSQGRVEIGGETEEGERYIGERGETEEGERYIGERGETEEGRGEIGGETEEGERGDQRGEGRSKEKLRRGRGEIRGETEEGEGGDQRRN
ncbi:UNVERIFIED_CONTAM: hypothetical protein FKN15_047968 [Acipenser sinensis]